MKKTICVDFDGVIHEYVSPWTNATTISDGVVLGAFSWIRDLIQHGYHVAIYSSRSKEPGAVEAMCQWFEDCGMSPKIIDELSFPIEKPPAMLTIDDRAICFRGTFPSVREIENFRPWNYQMQREKRGVDEGFVVRGHGRVTKVDDEAVLRVLNNYKSLLGMVRTAYPDADLSEYEEVLR